MVLNDPGPRVLLRRYEAKILAIPISFNPRSRSKQGQSQAVQVAWCLPPILLQ